MALDSFNKIPCETSSAEREQKETVNEKRISHDSTIF